MKFIHEYYFSPQVNVSLGRLRKFLGNDELDPDTVTKDDNASMYQ